MKQKLLLNQRLSLIWLLLVPLLLASCKRLDGNTVVEGQVVDRHTGEPIPDATLVMFSGKTNSSSAAYNTVEFEKQADSNGKFEFKFDSDGSKSYVLRAFKDPGYYTAWDDAAYLDEGRNNKKIKLKTQAPAWVKVKLVNVPPLDVLPFINIRGFNYIEQVQSHEEFYNLDKDTSFIRPVLGNKESRVIWRYDPQSAEHTTYEKIYPAGLDTVEVTIVY